MIQAWLSRYGRRRRLIAATLAAIAVISAYFAIRPTPPASVLVATRDLPPGPLAPADLHPTPLNHPPDGALRTITAATGRFLTSPMRKGEPLTDARLLTSYRLPPGMVATPVRISDPEAVSLMTPGSTIDVLAAWEESHPARSIAEDVTVITIPPRTGRSSDNHGALLVLATTPTQATELAAAQASARLSITIDPTAK
ncbi:Flp pilus assembly protein CpaB [Nonomuraea sp. H19]|uniref:Flp pilus assembly protein CpaB n=1 Tax=Nonomuraea sp. H19 TaxID=3452206 RepID=UPI003F8A3177